MKKYVWLIVAMFFVSQVAVLAQNQREAQRRVAQTPKEKVESMAKVIDLTAEERTQVEALFTKQDTERAKQRENVRANGQQQWQNADREKMRVQFEEQRKAEQADLEKIIGKERMEKYLQWQAEVRKQAQERGRR